MDNTVSSLLTSLITKTKDKTIRWQPFSSIAIKPDKSETRSSFLSGSTSDYALEPDNSYCARYLDGEFFLIASSRLGDLETSRISLSIQTLSSAYSVEYASTLSDDLHITSSLKRLYNIVDSMDYDIASFVERFINS